MDQRFAGTDALCGSVLTIWGRPPERRSRSWPRLIDRRPRRSSDSLPTTVCPDAFRRSGLHIGAGQNRRGWSRDRSSCAIASISKEGKKSFDVFFEAREVRRPGEELKWSSKTVGFPVDHLCTINAPPIAGQPVGQWIVLARLGFPNAPLVIDADKRSVEEIGVARFGEPYLRHEGIAYGSERGLGSERGRVFKLTPTCDAGQPDFRVEVVNSKVPRGRCFVYEGRVYRWDLDHLLRRRFSRAISPLAVQAPLSSAAQIRGITVAFGRHYGIILLTNDGLRSVELRPRSGTRAPRQSHQSDPVWRDNAAETPSGVTPAPPR